MRTFNMLFKMPKDKELFIAAWAAICTYENRIRNIGTPLTMTVIAEDDWLTRLLIPPMTFVIQNIEDVSGMYFDTVVDFADERILALSRFGKKAASICGVFLGIEDYVNELVALKAPEVLYNVCIIPWSDAYASYKLGERLCIEIANVIIAFGHEETIAKLALESRIVVGYRSVETYLATSANKVVLEGYDLETYDRNFLTKWSNPRYSMVCVEKKSDLDKNISLIWRALERSINAIQRQPRTEPV